MLSNEVTPVLKARLADWLGIAIHHHMTGAQPTIYFLRNWGTRPVGNLASGFKGLAGSTRKHARHISGGSH
jgi:hypothetical protein